MNTDNSAFYHFDILPGICIHWVEEDQYSKMYKPMAKCLECGHTEFREAKMKIIEGFPDEFDKRVHRCNECNEVRMATHIGLKDD
jgi:hypothetical protein